jgi:phosphohistidine phosphatase
MTADVDRPLSERGVRAADALARHLATFDQRPSIVMCSPATRARQTLAAIEGVLGPGTEIRIDPVVYDDGPDEILRALRDLPVAASAAMVIGHNPTMQDLALHLIGPNGGDGFARLQVKFPTAALATLTVPGGWDQLAAGCAELQGFWSPR